MEIKNVDVPVLDSILLALSKGDDVDSGYLVFHDIVRKDMKQRGEATKKAIYLMDSLNLYISHYCGKVDRNGAFGDDLYIFKRDNRTIKFMNDGGFKAEFERQEKEKERQSEKESHANELERLQKENLILQSEELIYHKKVRKWQIASIITGIIGVIIGILLNPVIIDLLNKLYNKQ